VYRTTAAALIITAVLSMGAASAVEKTAKEALVKAIEALNQSPELAGLKGPGPAALTAMALVAAGEDPTKEPLSEAIKYIERQAFTAPENQYVGTYTAATSLTLLHMAGRDAGAEGGAVETLAKRLIVFQEKDGSWGDVSRSQFAALGMYAARAMGYAVPLNVFERLRGYILSMQNLDGGWPYKDKGTMSTGSMTSGALAALHVVERALASGTPQCTMRLESGTPEKAIRRGLEWLAKNQSYDRNPGNPQYYFYYLYSLERALKYLGVKQLGELDWYSQAASRVLDLQRDTGTWVGPALDYPTQFAVLFLSRSGWPAAISKVEQGNDWNLNPYDAEVWSEELSRRLHMPTEQRTVTLDEPVEYLLQSPLIYITGRDALQIKDLNRLKLAEYVEKGGTLLFAPEYKGRGFVESAKKLVDELFPDNPLEPVEQDDALYLTPNLIDAKRLPVLGINLSCRIAVMVTEAPLGCALSGCSNGDVSGFTAEDMKSLAVNAGYYALGVGGYFKEKNRKDEYDWKPLVGTAPPEQGQAEFYVGWLHYKGDWHPFPEALGNLLRFVNGETKRTWWWKEVRPQEKAVFDCPLIFMTGSKAPQFTKEEKDNLKLYIEKGGRIIAEPACGSRPFVEGLRAFFQDMLPECRIERLLPGHSVFTCLFEISRVKYKDVVLKEDATLVYPWIEGVYWQGKLVALYSPFNLSAEWAEKGYVHSRGVQHRDAFLLGADMLAYFFLDR